MRKKNKANLALGISAAGLAGTMAMTGGNGGVAGLLYHGFLAATIGGLADWFAVTAIFHRPLGISYRTDILRRNRGRIMEAMVSFASDDLLSTRNIMSIVRDQPLSDLLIDYLVHRGGRAKVHETAEAVLLQAVGELDTKTVAEEITPAVRKGLSRMTIEDVVPELLRMLADEPYTRKLSDWLLSIGKRSLLSPDFQQILLEHIRAMREQYEKDSAGRALLLSSLGLSDERLLSLLTGILERRMDELLSGGSEDYGALKAGWETMLRAFSRDPRFLDLLRERREELFKQADLTGMAAKWMEWNLKGENPFWLSRLHAFIDAKIDKLAVSRPWQRRLDAILKDFIGSELERHHDVIAALIRERLAEFSDDALVNFVENKVQDDLQMIRINGSIVGALVGIGLYLVVCLMERMWGL